jgi:hypothetical protein
VPVSFSAPVYRVTEDDGWVEVCAQLVGNLQRSVVVQLTTLDLPGDIAQGNK